VTGDPAGFSSMDNSPRWSTNTKFIIMLAILVVVGFFLIRFQVLIMPVIMAVILAYLLNPLVTSLSGYLRISRVFAALILYSILFLLLVGLLGGAGLLLQQQLSGMLAATMAFINGMPGWINTFAAHPVTIGPFTFDLSTINTALLPTARDWIGQFTRWMTGAASGVASFLGWTVFVFIIALYLLHDMDALEKGLLQLVPESSRPDARRLLEELGPIWDAFLRGQLLLCLIMGVTIGSLTALLGVRYALILGLIATLTEFVPVIGANVIGIIIFFVAFFQPSNWFGLSPIVYAVVVTAIAGTMQQLKGYILIPRIMGDRLRIHPVIMIVGALIGVVLLGLPGLLLSAPIIATARLFGNYVRAKLLNLPPWPQSEEERSTNVKAPSARIRLARESDRSDMIALTAQMWEGHDYVPQVWSEWLADRDGFLAAAETEKRMVGFGKLTRMGPKEWWLEGLRVEPGYQGLKIGSQLTEYLVQEWQRRKGGVIRLATSSERVEVHHLCERLGFRRVGICRMMAAAPVARGACEFQPLSDADAKEAAALWKSNTALGTRDLINDNWQWSSFTEARLMEFIRRQRAWWWRQRSAVLLAYDRDRDHKLNFEVAAIIAPAGKLTPILRQLRVLAKTQKADRVVWVMPDNPRFAGAAKRAGFASTWNARLWIFERPDSPAAQP
jgi:predicted PurR-regulated permease PerM/GNAT superfamily N-acetyltransferase